MTIQGRQLMTSDIEMIRRLMVEHPDWHRSRLSIELCRMWNWRTDKGRLKDMACRSMLRKLEQRQFIVLPAALQRKPCPAYTRHCPQLRSHRICTGASLPH